MTPDFDFDPSDLVARYQVLCRAIGFWEPMSWQHPTLQLWLNQNGLKCRSAWHLPPAALLVLVQSLEQKLETLSKEFNCVHSQN